MFEVLKKIFAINLNDYENINVSLEINKAILGAFIALVVGVIMLDIYRGCTRTVIMQLVRHGAKTKEDAKTLSELKLENSRVTKKLLSGHNMLTRIVARVDEKEYGYDEYKALSKEEKKELEKIDFANARFYIREKSADRAAFITERYVTSVPRTVASCVFVAIICICVIACMPEILRLINNLLKTI
jgi:hypothetical protein